MINGTNNIQIYSLGVLFISLLEGRRGEKNLLRKNAGEKVPFEIFWTK